MTLAKKHERHHAKKSKTIHYPISDHCDGKRFFNPNSHSKKSLKDVIKMLRGRKYRDKWPKHIKNKATPKLAPALNPNQTYITYVNHASHLIQLRNLNILTDPLFSKKAGPLSLLGPKRVRDPGIALTQLPPIHVVLVSHNHYDHMDMASLRKLEKLFQPLFIVPLGNRKYFRNKKMKVIELDWMQTHSLNEQQTITLVPAVHWSLRKPNDINSALWGGFWIKSAALQIYFAGDTGYGPHFKNLEKEFGAPDISLLPIGAYEPRWFMHSHHINPEEAVLASLDLKSHLSIANHHLTFNLAYDGINDPTNELKASLKYHGISEMAFRIPENGETIIFEKAGETIDKPFIV